MNNILIKLPLLVFVQLLFMVVCTELAAQENKIFTFSSPQWDSYAHLCSDMQGNTYFIVSVNQESKLIKMDASGAVIWEKSTKKWFPVDVKVHGASLYVSGSYTSGWDPGSGALTAKGNSDVFVEKFDLNGNLVWVKTGGGSGSESGNFLAVDAEDNLYVAGEYDAALSIGGVNLSHGGEGDIFLAKYDKDGTAKWAKKIGCVLIDDLLGIGWVEKSKTLVLSCYIQLASNLGNGIITKNDSYNCIGYNSDGTAKKLFGTTNNQILLGTGQTSDSIYTHSGLLYSDSSGIIYVYDADMKLVSTYKTQKGEKNVQFTNSEIYVCGTSPLLVNNVVRYQGYIDIYDLQWNRKEQRIFSTDVKPEFLSWDGNYMWIAGSFQDTVEVMDKELIAQGLQDVFLLRIGSGIATVQEHSSPILNTFPNPFSTYFSIADATIESGSYCLSLQNMNGIKVLKKDIIYDGTYTIDEPLSSGIYLWQLSGRKTYLGRIVKTN